MQISIISYTSVRAIYNRELEVLPAIWQCQNCGV